MSNHLIVSFKEIFNSYKKWVSSNPQFVSDLESTAKWASYLIAGRISNSNILSELIYSLSNILVLFNDRIIEKANGFVPLDSQSGSTLKLLLTTLEYCEVFIEISAKKLWGSKGRWILIFIVQLVKTMGRYLLLNQYCEEIIRVPPIPPLDRKKAQKQRNEMDESCIPSTSAAALASDNANTTSELFGDCSISFKLKRSGRVIRKIEGAPPIHLRNWQPLSVELDATSETHPMNCRELKTAESLYIAKPLIHLGAIGLFGYRSWKSYTISLLLDLASIRLYYNHRHSLTKQQRVELSRRCVNLLLYFVRSPLYERSTERRLQKFVRGLGNIPLIGSICNPLADYIPHWQDTYFYMWSS